VFFSRSRQRLWEKGETSVTCWSWRRSAADCDGDALLATAWRPGPVWSSGHRELLRWTRRAHRRAPGLSRHPRSSHRRAHGRAARGSLYRAPGRPRGRNVWREEWRGRARGGARRPAAAMPKWWRTPPDLLYHVLVLLRVRGLPLERVIGELPWRDTPQSLRGAAGSRAQRGARTARSAPSASAASGCGRRAQRIGDQAPGPPTARPASAVASASALWPMGPPAPRYFRSVARGRAHPQERIVRLDAQCPLKRRGRLTVIAATGLRVSLRNQRAPRPEVKLPRRRRAGRSAPPAEVAQAVGAGRVAPCRRLTAAGGAPPAQPCGTSHERPSRPGLAAPVRENSTDQPASCCGCSLMPP